jgi:hypothetical protein
MKITFDFEKMSPNVLSSTLAIVGFAVAFFVVEAGVVVDVDEGLVVAAVVAVVVDVGLVVAAVVVAAVVVVGLVVAAVVDVGVVVVAAVVDVDVDEGLVVVAGLVTGVVVVFDGLVVFIYMVYITTSYFFFYKINNMP